jgi:hypothetical protein
MKSIQCGVCGKPVEQSKLLQHLVINHRWKEIVTPAPASTKPPPQNKPLPKQTRCPGCNVLFESKAAYKRHHKTCQLTVPTSKTTPDNLQGMSICPYCDVSISPKKFEKHIRSKCPKRKGARQVSRAGNEFYTDPEIEKYLALHPEPPKIGKFGVPQAKFKYNTYGRSGMEFDTWGKS